jgi:hypothetical protein
MAEVAVGRWLGRIGIVLGGAAAVIALAVLLAVVYLSTADLGRHRERIERRLSAALGYEVRFRTLRVELALSGPSLVEARDAVVCDPTAQGAALVEIAELRARFELRELFDGTVHLRDLEVRGLGLALPRAGSPTATAELENGRIGDPATAIPRLVVDRALFEESRVDLGRPRPVALDIDRLELRTDASQAIELEFRGGLAGRRFELAGTVGPLGELVAAGRVRSDLRLAFGGSRATLTGSVADLATLRELRATFAAEGADLDEVARALGLAAPGSGRFSIEAELVPAAGATGIDLHALLGALDVRAAGRLDSLLDPGSCDLTVVVAGPSLAEAARLAGVDGLPARPFRVTGRVAWDGFPLTLDDLRLEVGDNRLDLDGVLGAPPDLEGTSLHVEGVGPDASEIGALAGLRLPRLPYRVAGRLDRAEGALVAGGVEASLGASRLELNGRVDGPSGARDVELSLHAYGPSLATLSELAARDLPDEPFDLDGRVAWRREGSGFAGSELELEDLRARVGDVELEASGRIALDRGGAGTALAVRASGPNAFRAGSLAGYERLPHAPFALEGDVGIESDAVRLEHVALRVGELELAVEGRLATNATREGSELALAAAGPRLAELHGLTGPIGLPEAPFTLSGRVAVREGAYRLDGVRLSVRDHALELDGSLSPVAGLAGSALTATIAGPSLAALGELAAGPAALPPWPDEPYSAAGSLRVLPDGYELGAVRLALGTARGTVDGRLGSGPAWRGSDLLVAASGPETSSIAPLIGAPLPAGPFEVTGRVRRTESGTTFEDLSLRLGEQRAWLDGTLGEPPGFAGSDLRFRGEGPDLAWLELWAGPFPRAAGAWFLAGHARGSPERFEVEGLELRLGPGDLRGDVALELGARRRLAGRLASDLVDLTRSLPPAEAEPPAQPPEPEGEAPPEEPLFGDEPLDLTLLDRFDADIVWRIARLDSPWGRAVDLDVTIHLADGTLTLGPFEAAGEPSGRLSGSLRIEPVATGHALAARLAIDDARTSLGVHVEPGVDPATRVNARVMLDVRGRTPRELATSASGIVTVFLEGGVVHESVLDLSLFGVLRRIAALVNPFGGGSKELSELECAAFVIEADDGLLVLEPAAVRTSNLTLAGRGSVDLTSERIELEWVAKPRKGVGIGTTSITNPYIKLGGTLTRPRVSVKPVEAIASTGAAVATAGLSLLGQGLWDRVTAERNVCRKARKEAERRLAEAAPP